MWKNVCGWNKQLEIPTEDGKGEEMANECESRVKSIETKQATRGITMAGKWRKEEGSAGFESAEESTEDECLG